MKKSTLPTGQLLLNAACYVSATTPLARDRAMVGTSSVHHGLLLDTKGSTQIFSII